jgi:branched-chain amino acid transport system permease protein
MALPALRLSGIYLAMATLGFAQFTQWAFLNWETVTFGAGGFRLPPLDFSALAIRSELGIYYLSWIVAVGLVVFAWNAMRSRIGRAFVAMRDGEIAAEALGIDLLRYKALAFALSGVYAGIAGGLFGALLNYVAPETFDLFQMIIHKAMVMVGGIGSITGSIIGATLLVLLLEALRAFKSTQEIAFGAILLAFVVFCPGGLVSICRRWLPYWEEPLHVASGAADAPPGPAPAAAGDAPTSAAVSEP